MTRTTLFTCSVYPDLTRVWYRLAVRHTDPCHVSILVYDCSGSLTARDLPGARLLRRPNIEHGANIDHAIRHDCTTPYLFLCDDDVFLVSRHVEPEAVGMLTASSRVAAVSFWPRTWWNLVVDGRRHPVMGTSAVILRMDVMRAEGLSFRRRPASDPSIREGEDGYYDTGDYAGEQLVRRGYTIRVPDPEARRGRVAGYSGVSRGFLHFGRTLGGGKDRAPGLEEAVVDDIVGHGAHPRWPLEKLRWACGIAATIALHRYLVGVEPAFAKFLDYGSLRLVARRFPAHCRDEARAMVEEGAAVLNRLLTTVK